jgi:hypothetical protein
LAAAAIIAASATTIVAVPAQAAKAPAKPGDFNGDGRRDVVVGVPRAGVVSVAYSGTKKRQKIAPKGARRTGFGLSTVSADFDRDGYADLAITGTKETGVTVVYGSRMGLAGRRAFLPSQAGLVARESLAVGDFDRNGRPDLISTVGLSYWTFANVGKGKAQGRQTTPPPHPENEISIYSYAPVAADFTGDGYADLVLLPDTQKPVGTPVYENGPFLQLAKGSAGGLRAPSYLPTEYESAAGGAAGDINGDGRADLVVGRGISQYDYYDHQEARVYYGRADGLSAYTRIAQDQPGVPGQEQADVEDTHAAFGYSIAIGDVNRDGKADVAISDPIDQAVSEGPTFGSVTLLYGSSKGITTKGAQFFTESTKGIPGNRSGKHLFGQSIAFTDVNADGRSDLLIGVPGVGKVFRLRSVKGRLSTSGLATYGLPGAAFRFGESIMR